MILTVAGIAQYGTESAAEFVTNPSYFSQALKDAPPDWRNRNMQVLLSTPGFLKLADHRASSRRTFGAYPQNYQISDISYCFGT